MKITGPSDSTPPKKERVSETNKVADKKAASTASLNKDSGVTTQGAAAASEKIAVSDVGKEIAKIQGQLKKTPDVRADKVKSIKSQINDGSYYVNSDKIASKIMEDIVKNG
ncbi:MAG: flagellar biosynthesis anti-sigma factor FlgM [Nitrospinae bacterium]|nr:flagellar biosynthesis anti-sigma factor FlgM [Nitrospinota bacterium]